MSDVTRILSRIESGDPSAAEQLLPLVYEELRKLAAVKLAREKPGQTLQATALVHEAYLRLLGPGEQQPSWDGRGHFFAAAAEAMRRILVETARRRQREKHGGQLQRVELGEAQLGVEFPLEQLLSVNDAMDKLSQADSQIAELVKLHCFGGLSVEQAGELLGMPARTAYRNWAYARAWLFRELGEETADEGAA